MQKQTNPQKFKVEFRIDYFFSASFLSTVIVRFIQENTHPTLFELWKSTFCAKKNISLHVFQAKNNISIAVCLSQWRAMIESRDSQNATGGFVLVVSFCCSVGTESLRLKCCLLVHILLYSVFQCYNWVKNGWRRFYKCRRRQCWI